ncbi:MAG: hypothetical protein L0229_27695 [Blastocatellia bacterium]|nr:hypothetical protein [Blastocatellia bacterium]
MQVYVRSRGRGPDRKESKETQDYFYWLECETNEKTSPLEFWAMKEYARLIEPEEFGLLIARRDSKLVLIVARLISTDRIDFQQTPVFNSLVCISDDPEDERCLRGIAVAALDENGGCLRDIVDQAITFDADSPIGWRVSKDLVDKLKEFDALGSSPPKEENLTGENNRILREGLKKDLNECALPTRSGILVVVTKFISIGDFVTAEVWRSLSAGVSSNDWLPLKNFNTEKKKKRGTGCLLIPIVIVGGIITLGLF